jgi:hypothetical protein
MDRYSSTRIAWSREVFKQFIESQDTTPEPTKCYCTCHTQGWALTSGTAPCCPCFGPTEEQPTKHQTTSGSTTNDSTTPHFTNEPPGEARTSTPEARDTLREIVKENRALQKPPKEIEPLDPNHYYVTDNGYTRWVFPERIAMGTLNQLVEAVNYLLKKEGK